MESLLHRGYQYRLYPTEEQQTYLMQTFGCRRKVYNAFVDSLYQQLEAAGYENGYLNKKQLTFETPAAMKSEFPFLKEVDSLALCNAQLDFQQAITNFNEQQDHKSYTKRSLRRKKNQGVEPTFRDLKGMPRFKSAKKGDFYFTTNNQSNGGKWNLIAVVDGFLKIPKLKTSIKINLHRPLPEGCIIKNATISKNSRGHYYVSLGVEFVRDIEPVQPEAFLGLDYAQQAFYVDSEGEKANYPHFYRKTEAKLAREQRKLSRMEFGSANWEKQKKRVATLHERVANQRKDWLHKQSTALANAFDAIGVEDIDLRAMSQTLRLAKNLMDNGFGMFRTMLQYKLEERGKCFVKIDRFYPCSKECHCCGYVYQELELGEETWTCPCCGATHDRNENAAINIREVTKQMVLIPV